MNDISQTRQMRLGFIAPTSLATQMTRHPTVDNTLGTTYNISSFGQTSNQLNI
jgi:hypothetical protein